MTTIARIVVGICVGVTAGLVSDLIKQRLIERAFQRNQGRAKNRPPLDVLFDDYNKQLLELETQHGLLYTDDPLVIKLRQQALAEVSTPLERAALEILFDFRTHPRRAGTVH